MNITEEMVEVKKEVIEEDDDFSWPREESSEPVQAFSSPVKMERKDSTEQGFRLLGCREVIGEKGNIPEEGFRLLGCGEVNRGKGFHRAFFS